MNTWLMMLLESSVYMDEAGDSGSDTGGTSGTGDGATATAGTGEEGDKGSGSGDRGDGESGDDSDDGGEGGEGNDKALETAQSEIFDLKTQVAALLKETMSRKTVIKERDTELDTLRSKVSKFESAEADAEEKRLEGEKDIEGLKNRWTEKHTAAIDELKSSQQTELQTRDGKIAELTNLLNGQEKNTKFANSPVPGQLGLTPTKVEKLWGDRFDVVDGKTVPFDRPRGEEGRTEMIGADGQTMPFDDALSEIVKQDPDYEALAKITLKPGAGSSSSTGGKAPTASTARGVNKIEEALKEGALKKS